MTNNNQQIDLNAIYGLDKCQSPPCEIKNPSMVNTVSYKPSLEQIASYVEGNRQPVAQTQMQNNQSQNNIQGDLSQMYQPITPQQAAMYPTPAVVAAENQGEISQSNNENADMIVDVKFAESELVDLTATLHNVQDLNLGALKCDNLVQLGLPELSAVKDYQFEKSSL